MNPLYEGATAPLWNYSQALDEIYRLRRALAYEAGALEAHLDYKAFPKSRRKIAQDSITRMRGCARGHSEIAYAGTKSIFLDAALRQAGAKETLTRYQFEAERGIRSEETL